MATGTCPFGQCALPERPVFRLCSGTPEVVRLDGGQLRNAQAYTVGPSIVFQRDHYDPTSESGRHMLAHELTHVVQQRSGPVDGTDAGNGVKVSDPSDQFEREAVATADRVMSGPAAVPQAASSLQRCGGGSTHDSAPAQREAVPPELAEEGPAAQTFVQRAEEEEETAGAAG